MAQWLKIFFQNLIFPMTRSLREAVTLWNWLTVFVMTLPLPHLIDTLGHRSYVPHSFLVSWLSGSGLHKTTSHMPFTRLWTLAWAYRFRSQPLTNHQAFWICLSEPSPDWSFMFLPEPHSWQKRRSCQITIFDKWRNTEVKDWSIKDKKNYLTVFQILF